MILDTNAVSALAARDKSLIEVISGGAMLALSFIAYAEFRYGLLGSKRPSEGIQLLEDLTSSIPLLLPDRETLEQYAHIEDQLKRKGHPIPTNDIWIAALARQHAMPVLSRDRHFDFIPDIQRLDW
jgi:predicted nucleic acid-binding protein